MNDLTFKSGLAPYMIGLIKQKQAIGYKYEAQTDMLIRFDEFCVEMFPNEITITKDMLDIWAVKKSYEAPGTLRSRVTIVSHLAQYMSSLGMVAYVYPTDELPKEPKYIPHIFSEEELVKFFHWVDCCHYSPVAPNRHIIMPVLFRTLYCCGLRPGEVIRLKTEDVDLKNGILLIRKSKNDNDRYVPMSEELAERYRDYAAKVHREFSAHEYFFPAPNGGMIPMMNIYSNFRRFLCKAGISHGGKGKGPRLYDFRHTFAVHCLRRLIRSGKNPAVYHQALKTYMGHSFFKYTAYYLRLTNDMFPDIREKVTAYYRLNILDSGGGADD